MELSALSVKTMEAGDDIVEKIGLGVLVEGGGSEAFEDGRRAGVEVRVWLVVES